VLLLPVGVAVLVGLHLLMVRHRGVVRPLPLKGAVVASTTPAGVGAGGDGAHPNGSRQGG
jgi:hypothetical protein